MSKLNRIGARIDRDLVQAALGFLPEVGEAFEIDGLVLRVMARTVGVEPTEDRGDIWFDELFVASVEDVADLEAAGRVLRERFDAIAEAHDEAPDEAKPAVEAAIVDLDEAIKREIEDILKAA